MNYRTVLLVFMMLSFMSVKADEMKADETEKEVLDKSTIIEGVSYTTYLNEEGNIKVFASKLESDLPADVDMKNSVSFQLTIKDFEGNEEIRNYGPYEVDALNVTFENNHVIKSVKLPTAVRTLPNSIFYGCDNLQSVTLPPNITDIPRSAFAGSSIKEVNIPGKVKVIGEAAFAGCKNLSVVNIPDGVELLPASVFANSAISSVTIPASVKMIDQEAFINCENLNKIAGTSGVTIIKYNAFKNCKLLDGFDFRNVEIIEPASFEGCSSLEYLYLPNITTIGENGFMNCTNLTEVRIGSRIETIGKSVFAGCKNIIHITICNSNPPGRNDILNDGRDKNKIPLLIVLDADEFKNTYPWQDVFYDKIQSFMKCPNGFFYLDKENKTASFVGRILNNDSHPAPSKINKVTESCDTISIPETITVEGEDYTVNAISCLALCYDAKTESFTIPATINSIGEAAFQYCDNMKSFYCLASQVPQTDITAFRGTNISDATLYVPNEAVENYRNSSPWNGFGSIIGIETTLIRDMKLNGKRSKMWYNLNGQLQTKEPQQRGVYIHQGKKLSIQ